MQKPIWLRVGVVVSSLSLMSGFVYWRAYAGKPAPVQRDEQKPTAPTVLPGSKSAILVEPSAAPTLLPGSKSEVLIRPSAGYPGYPGPKYGGNPGPGYTGVPSATQPAQQQAAPQQPAKPPVLLPGSKSMVISADELLYGAPAQGQPPAQTTRPTAKPPKPFANPAAPPTQRLAPQGSADTQQRAANLPPAPAPRPKTQPTPKPQLRSF